MLLLSPVIAEAVGERIFNGDAPEGSTFPAITFIIESERPFQHSQGLSGTYEATVELVAWALPSGSLSAYAVSMSLARAIRKALIGAQYRAPDGSLWIQDLVEEGLDAFAPEVDTGLVQTSITVDLIYSEHDPIPAEPDEEE